MQGLIVRELRAHEKTMALTNWKKEMWDRRSAYGWSRGLEERDYWALANYVIDRITLPTCNVYTGCHETDLETPMCWVAIRRIPSLLDYEIVYLYARKTIWRDPALAAALERELLSMVEHEAGHPLAKERRQFNPFLELRR